MSSTISSRVTPFSIARGKWKFICSVLPIATSAAQVIKLRSRLDNCGRSQMSPNSTSSVSSTSFGAKSPSALRGGEAGVLVFICVPPCSAHYYPETVGLGTISCGIARSVDGAVLHSRLGGQRESRFSVRVAQHLPRDVLAERGTVLESVPGTAADEPDVFHLGVAVDQEVAVRRVFVLADSRFDDGRVFEGRETMRHIVARLLGHPGADDPRLHVGIDHFAVKVQSDLQAALVDVRGTVEFVLHKEPCWECVRGKARVTGRHSEKELLLAGGKNARAKQRGEDFAEPGATGKHERPGSNGFAAAAFDGGDA